MPTVTLTDAPPRLTTVNNPQPILRIARAMSRSVAPMTIEIPLTTGEVFHANGSVMRIPRGEVDASFVRRVGTVNRTVVEPPVPATVPMRSIRVPAGMGAIVVIDWALFCTEQIGQRIAPAVEMWDDYLIKMTALQDCDLAQKTAAVTQFKPQEAAQRLRAVAMTRTKTARGAARKSTIIRAFSRR